MVAVRSKSTCMECHRKWTCRTELRANVPALIGLGRFDPRSAFVAAFALGLPITLATAVLAQERPIYFAQNDKTEKLDALKEREEDLKAARDAQSKAAENQAALKREIEQLGADRRKLNQSLIETAGRICDVEAHIAATEARLKPLDENESNIRKSLDGRRTGIAEVLAALQRIGHRPPPALIASPEDALQAVRTARLLREQGRAERERLTGGVAALANERARMTALIDERQKQQAEREKALDAERTRAADLARQGDNLRDLIAKLEQGREPATRAAREAQTRPDMASHDPGRLAPAVAFASLRGQVPIPVNGIKLKDNV